MLLYLKVISKKSLRKRKINYNDDFLKFPLLSEVIDEFFKYYQLKEIESHKKYEFQKHPNGWYITLLEYNLKEKKFNEVSTERFWDLKTEKYKVVDFTNANSNTTIKQLQKENFIQQVKNSRWGRGYPNWDSYYNIFPYYGYEGYEKDVIDLLKDAKNLPDTTLYALARSYIEYTNSYSEKKDLENYLKFTNIALKKFEDVKKLNPNFETIVGKIETKIENEKMHAFLDLSYKFKNKQQANKILKSVKYSPTWERFAKNILMSCDKNAILFTNGDNDTYPLIYAQELLGFRKDVKIINITLSNINEYLLHFIYNEPKVYVQNNKLAFCKI